MEIVKHYRDNKALRDSFNALAEGTFGLNFENWYQNGFWKENYEPYSVVEEGRIVANVSVNRTDMVVCGTRRKLLQLGTVMTAEEYRNRGYIRAIMAEVEQDFRDVDGVYLFGNDSVVEFYPKFGFRKGKEFLYAKNVEQAGENKMVCVPMTDAVQWAVFGKAMEQGEPLNACAMVDDPGLIFFYVAQFMQENVFYCEALKAWAIAELEEGELLLHNVFCGPEVKLDDVIRAFGADVKRVTLGFAPKDADGWEKEAYHEEDCTFFVKGGAFDDWEEKELRIPSLSHA